MYGSYEYSVKYTYIYVYPGCHDTRHTSLYIVVRNHLKATKAEGEAM